MGSSCLVCVKDRQLYIGKRKIELLRPIDQVLVIDKKIVYRFSLDGKDVLNRNIGALDFDGNHLWLIEEMQSKLDCKAFDKMYINDKGELIACNYIGADFVVDTSTGSLKYWRFQK